MVETKWVRLRHFQRLCHLELSILQGSKLGRGCIWTEQGGWELAKPGSFWDRAEEGSPSHILKFHLLLSFFQCFRLWLGALKGPQSLGNGEKLFQDHCHICGAHMTLPGLFWWWWSLAMDMVVMVSVTGIRALRLSVRPQEQLWHVSHRRLSADTTAAF